MGLAETRRSFQKWRYIELANQKPVRNRAKSRQGLTRKIQLKTMGFNNIVTGGSAEIRLAKSRMLSV